MSTLTSDNWRSGCNSETIESTDVEVCDSVEEVVTLLSSVCMSVIFTIKFHSVNHLVKEVRRTQTYSVRTGLFMSSKAFMSGGHTESRLGGE